MLKCLYAILYAPDPHQQFDFADIEGLDGSPVYAILYKNIFAAVSTIDKHPLKLSKELAWHYESIIERIMVRYTLLPVRFGTLVKDDPEIIAILQKYYPEFIHNLRQVKGKLEYGVKLLWDVGKMRYPALSEMRGTFPPLDESSPYKQYLLKKFKEHQFEDALMQKAESIIARIHTPLKELSVSSKFKKMITKKILLDATYLVKRETQNTFIHKVEELVAKERDVKFLLTGPWPPYSFIENFSDPLLGGVQCC